MEEDVFLRPQIAKLLADHYIEARLHCDGPAGEMTDRNLALQKKYAGNRALPTFVIVDPKTEAKRAKKSGRILTEELAVWLEQYK